MMEINAKEGVTFQNAKYTTGTSLFHTCRRIVLTANNVRGTLPIRAFFTVSVTLANFRPR